MFQFTREFIINDLEGNLFIKGATSDKDQKGKIVADDYFIYIENLINIEKKSIHSIYKNNHVPASEEKVTWRPTVTSIKTGDIVRIIATLYQDDNVVASFASPVPNTGRTIQYEFEVKADGNLVATGDSPVKDLYATLEVTDNTITIKAKDCFTHVSKIEIVKDAVSDSNIGVGAVKVDSVKKGDDALDIVTEGTPGLGNTAQILRNMRLQTSANLNPYGLDIDERPKPNGTYDMYTVELVTERHNVGHDVVGSIGTSLTTLVFYVDTAVSLDFSKFFTADGSLIVVTDDDKDGKTDENEELTGKESGIILND